MMHPKLSSALWPRKYWNNGNKLSVIMQC